MYKYVLDKKYAGRSDLQSDDDILSTMNSETEFSIMYTLLGLNITICHPVFTTCPAKAFPEFSWPQRA